MHRSRVSHRTWLWAAWLMVTSKRGVSALELRRQLGIGSYPTAFQMLHRLRAAMVAPDQTLLAGTVEVDESYIGAPKEGARGRGANGKALIIGAVECSNGAPRRLRFRIIERLDMPTLHKFVHEVTEEGSTVQTDGNPSYVGIKRKHRPMVASRPGQDPDEVLPCYHLAVSNLKAWLQGTFHGAVRKQHLQAYLNEYAFRFNRRNNLHAAFQTLLGLAPKVTGPTYRGLYDGDYVHPGLGKSRQGNLPL